MSNPPSFPSAPTPSAIPTYLVQSILVTVFCCLPFGIVGIVFASQVSSKLAAGDYAGAAESSRQAKKWCLIGVGVGVLALVIYFVFVGILAAGGHLQKFAPTPIPVTTPQ